MDALKQVAVKLKIPEAVWDFRLDPCSEWVPSRKTRYIGSNLTCGCYTTTTTTISVCHVVSM